MCILRKEYLLQFIYHVSEHIMPFDRTFELDRAFPTKIVNFNITRIVGSGWAGGTRNKSPLNGANDYAVNHRK